MDFVSRCNILDCRAQPHDRAVVTTCSHIFCIRCADTTGLSRSSNGNRICPVCQAQLTNPDDVVVALLNPAEDYKTSVLSGLSPTIIMECASRGLAFYSYQASQEVIYQEHRAKSLAEKKANLEQSLDELILEANGRIKTLHEKIQAMQDEQESLEQKNAELSGAFKEKCRAQQQIQKMYQSLKAQVMATHVANAAGNEAEFAMHTARGDRFVDRLPGARSGAANLSQFGPSEQRGGGRPHNRAISGSSGSSGQQRGGVGLGSQWNPQTLGRRFGNRMHTGQSAPVGTPGQVQGNRSGLPVLGGTRQNAFLNADVGPSYRASPMALQSVVGDVGSRNMSYGVGGGNSRRDNRTNTGRLGC